jgi:hypothetical protein
MSARVSFCCVLLLACGSAPAPPAAEARPPGIAEGPTPIEPVEATAVDVIAIPEPLPGQSPREVRSSVLRARIHIPLGPIARAANDESPTLLANGARPGNLFSPAFRYRVTRGTIALGTANGAMEWSVPVHLDGSTDVAGGCSADLTARLSTRLSVTPDWHLAARSRRGPIAWQRRCRLLMGFVDVTDAIEPRVRDAQDEMARAIEERLAAEDLRPAIVRMWEGLSGRIALPEELGLWLRPGAIALSELRSSEGALDATLEIAVRPIAAIETPADAAPVPLPEHAPTETSDEGFVLYTDVELPLARVASEIERAARPMLASMGAELVRVRGIGGTDGVYFGFELALPAQTTLWFGASFGVDPAARALTISNAHPTEETRAALARLGLHIALLETLFGSNLSVPVGDRLDAIRAQYEAAMGSRIGEDERAQLRVSPGSIELAGTYHTPTHAGVVLAIAGSAELEVRP